MNLIAASAGLLQADAAIIDAVNAVDEDVTVATLPDATPVSAGEMVATIKIIPFAVSGATLERARAACSGRCNGSAPLAAAPGRAGAEHPARPQAVRHRGHHRRHGRRVAGIGGALLTPLQCPHRTEPIAAALRSLLEDGADLLLIAGASAVV